MAVVGAIGVAAVASGVGSAIQSNAAGQAGKAAANADQQAALLEQAAGQQANAQDMGIYYTEKSNLAPFINYGQTAASNLAAMTGNAPGTNPYTAPLTARFTGADLASTPGYQFTLNQGLEATQNSFAARGLASSGAALKGAANYATGLADSTYNQQLQNYLTQNNQIYNMLAGQANLGATAATNLGNSSSAIAGGNALVGAAGGAANAIGAGGAAQAAGITGSAAPYTNLFNTVGSLAGAYGLNQLQSQAANGNNSQYGSFGDGTAAGNGYTVPQSLLG